MYTSAPIIKTHCSDHRQAKFVPSCLPTRPEICMLRIRNNCLVPLLVLAMLFKSVCGFRALPNTSRLLSLVQFSTNRPGARSGRHHAFKHKAATQEEAAKDRPFTLPPGLHRPKQSLGQNYLSDQNYVVKICDAFKDESDQGDRVVEIGPGMGALTRVLMRRYPKMTALEIDQRSVKFLIEKLPGLNVLHQDVLEFDWCQLAADKGGKLSVVANLPYHITSQVLFSLADSYKAIDKAVVTMQWEVAERVTAKPNSKQYGIPSVVFQLYGRTELNFKIPPKVFFPVPKVDSALITIDFTKPHKHLHLVEGEHLRRIVTAAFRQRRKMLRQSLKGLLAKEKLVIPEKWGVLRPEQLKPAQFIELTLDLFGPRGSTESNAAMQRAHQAAALHREITSNHMTGKAAQRIKDQVALLYDEDQSIKVTEEESDNEDSQDTNNIAVEKKGAKKAVEATKAEERDGTSEPEEEATTQNDQDTPASRSARGRLLRPAGLSRRELRRSAQVSGDSSNPTSSPVVGSNDSNTNVKESEDIDAILAAVNRDPAEVYVKKSNAAKKAEKFGPIQREVVTKVETSAEAAVPVVPKADKSQYVSDAVWRRAFSNFNI